MNFDPLEKELRQALDCDAVPSGDFARRVMARVAETPQQPSRAAAPYRKWAVTAAACLVLAGAAIPLALHGTNVGSDSTAADQEPPQRSEVMNEMVAGDTEEDTAGTMAQNDGLHTETTSQKEAAPHDQPFDPLDGALDTAASLLEQQGCLLEVTARTEEAVQVTAADADGHTAAYEVLAAAMEDAGFTLRDGWYTLEAATP